MAKKIFCLTLDPENVEKLKEILKKENMPLSTFVDALIEEFILNRKEVKNYGVFSKSP
jgi:selenophosphate synthetase-related protein